MPTIEPDTRSPERKALDEAIAAEPHEPIPPMTPLRPIEHFFPELAARRVVGVVENGLVRPLDPAVRLTEQQRVLVVLPAAAGGLPSPA